MKQMKVMSLPECDKLLYCSGTIGRQIGTMFIYDDEKPLYVESYPILAGGRDMADGQVQSDTECYETPVVCRVGEKISPTVFSQFVKRAMHEEVPYNAWDLYQQLRENGSDLRHPILASTQEPDREYTIELEFHDFIRRPAASLPTLHRSISRHITTATTRSQCTVSWTLS